MLRQRFACPFGPADLIFNRDWFILCSRAEPMREAPLKMHANVLTLNPRGPRVAVSHITFYQLT